jgi:predicted ribonuclease YlaK
MLKKIQVIDTNIFLSSPDALFELSKKYDVVIPFKVFEELDNNKRRPGTIGVNARKSIRVLDSLRKLGNLHKGVSLKGNKGKIFVELQQANYLLPQSMEISEPDNQIVSAAMAVKQKFPNAKVVFISNDINLRLKCDALGLESEDYDIPFVANSSEFYDGFKVVLVDGKEIDKFYSGKSVILKEEKELFPNQYIMLQSNSDEKKTALARFAEEGQPLKKLLVTKEDNFWGLTARNKEQLFALDAILNPEISLVTINGKSGSGKTLCALAAALEMVVAKKIYKKIIVIRPVVTVGKDIGYLPGPQPHGALLATPDGWKKMGELAVGAQVIAGDGTVANITDIKDFEEEDIYEVHTSDKTVMRCTLDHLFLTQTKEEVKRNKPGSVRTLREIVQTEKCKIWCKQKLKANHHLPRNGAVQYKKQKQFIPPYAFGALLGDGYFGDSIVLINSDKELVQRVGDELLSIGYKFGNLNSKCQHLVKRTEAFYNKTARPVNIFDIGIKENKKFNRIGEVVKLTGLTKNQVEKYCATREIVDNKIYTFLEKETKFTNLVKEEIFKLGLLGCKAWEKFIPDIYKYSSIEDRINLIRGLMDTDGTVKKSTGESGFTTTSLRLANDIVEVVRSLGGRASICERNRVGKISKIQNRDITKRRVSYEFTVSLPEKFNPFYISRKAKYYKQKYIHRIRIDDIKLVGREKVRCIKIDHPSSLYLTDNFLVTHNSVTEKLQPFISPIIDNLNFLFGAEEDLDLYLKKKIIEVEAVSFIRGRSIPNSIIIFDETQNISKLEAKTVLTRVGESTKIILTGDQEQIDEVHVNEFTNGLTNTIEKFKKYKLSAHITLKKGERSELATLASEIL